MAASKAQGQRDAAARAARLPPELAFLSAIMRQLLADARSPYANIRAEARQFLRNEKHVQFWDDFLALNGRLLQEAAALVGDQGV